MPLPLYTEFVKNLSESLHTTATITKEPTKLLNSSFALSDSKLFSIIHILSDSLSISDGEEGIIQRLLSESFGLSSSVTKSELRSLSDAIAMSATMTRSTDHVLSDSFNFADAITRSMIRILSDTITGSDAYSRVWELSREYSEETNLSDALTKQEEKALSDSLGLTDSKTIQTIKLLSESMDFSDILEKVKTLPMYAEFYKNLSETMHLTDNYERLWLILREYSESIDATDLLTKDIFRTLSQTLNATDVVNKETDREMDEGISLTDNYDRTWIAIREYSESTTLTDEINKYLQRTLSETLDASDGDMIVFYAKTFTESLDVSDHVLRRAYDTASLTEARNDIQEIIMANGIQGVVIRQTESTESMGDTASVSEQRYDIYLMIQDITRKDRQIHEMGLAIPGNVKAFVFHEYPDSITGNGTFDLQTGDIITDEYDKEWRVEQIISEHKMDAGEVFRTAVLKRIDLDDQ